MRCVSSAAWPPADGASVTRAHTFAGTHRLAGGMQAYLEFFDFRTLPKMMESVPQTWRYLEHVSPWPCQRLCLF